MSDEPKRLGRMMWSDLTVVNADEVATFYETVIGWTRQEFDGDYGMVPPGESEMTTGVCYKRGPNANLPSQWLIYWVVEDLEKSSAECVRLGGKVVTEPYRVMDGVFSVIQDTAGAVCALFQYLPKES